MELRGKKIIVTGAARGMGAATVRCYVGAGAQVVAMDLQDEAGQQVVADANAAGPGRAGYLHVDVADRDSIESAFREAVQRLMRAT
jgi:3-oxoacyl-[acyl-carrier protein] reductase